MKKLLVIASLGALVLSCNIDNSTRQTTKPSTEQPANPNSDNAISQQIKQRLENDDSLSDNASSVNVSTTGGVVTLRGNVDSEQEKQKVIMMVKQVNGVKSVNSRLEVKPSR